jgi:UDP:flavonoid glycosyltransferase YjiC (YdhE family)
MLARRLTRLAGSCKEELVNAFGTAMRTEAELQTSGTNAAASPDSLLESERAPWTATGRRASAREKEPRSAYVRIASTAEFRPSSPKRSLRYERCAAIGAPAPIMSRRRILFLAEAVTLAHVARPVALARSLDAADWEIQLATDSRYARAIGTVPFPIAPLWTIPPERFRNALQRGAPIYTAESLDRYVEEDTLLINSFRPDVIVGDFRISLAISARKANIPYVNITNAYWSPYAKIRHVVPEITLARVAPLRLAQILFDLLRGAGYAVHALPVNKIRRKRGLEPLPLDFRWAIVEADATLYADIPEVIPTLPLPTTHRFVGPIAWSPSVQVPDWWPEIEVAAATRPVVYVNIGSSGAEGALARVLAALGPLPVTVVAATAGRNETLPATSNSRVAAYLPGDACARLASVVVCNGGSPASYQALAAGRPVIGLAANTDQFLNMAAVEDAGCGVLLRAHHANEDAIRKAVSWAIEDHHLVRGAEAARDSIARYDPAAEFRLTLEKMLLHADA